MEAINPPKLQLVMLHHTGVEQPHYDVMFETEPGSLLTTFRFSELPSLRATEVEKLPDHRRLYLDYEGPVSNNRGQVRRVAWCSCWVNVNEPERISLTLDPIAPFDRNLIFWKTDRGEWFAQNEPY